MAIKSGVHIKVLTIVCSSIFSFSVFAGGGGGGSSSSSGGVGGLPQPESCQSNCGFETGPNPDLDFLQASVGPQAVMTIGVSRSVSGFGGGTIYYPSNLSEPLAAIAIAPGFTNTRSAVAWWGPILASHGFVAITIDTNSRFDQPESRGRQLDSALSYLISEGKKISSPLYRLIDEGRLATMGFSMGGGGALDSASRNRLSAVVPLAPWRLGSNDYDDIRVPTMIMACEDDRTAQVGVHARPFYNRIPNSTDKAYMEINNGQHNCSTGQERSFHALLSTYGISWLKRHLDKDSRYSPFLCGPNHLENPAISDYRDTCNI